MKFEILAPAGSMESLIAGVRCGANAVYLGGQTFNARRNAGNFDAGQMQEAVAYCHQRNVRVYLTMNILTSDDEIPSALAAAQTALDAGIDAFIVQDLGLARVLRTAYPSVRLHASTQCAVLSPAGFRRLESMGFCRAVLPREMTALEIEEVRRHTGMELELFVHGALCMCVSGQCYLSSVLGGRSGNRGLCAQPCRLPFSANADKSCDLSLKDLSLLSHLKEIEALGVVSLKIEGRMKRPEYVAAAVTAVKKAMDGSLETEDQALLRSVFSRSGFTDGYFTGRRGSAMFGVRSKADVTAAAGALKSLARLYDKEKPLVLVDFDFVCKAGEPAVLTASAGGRTTTVYGAVPEPARQHGLTAQQICSRLEKLGGTQYSAGRVQACTEEGLMLSAAAINAMRRQAVEQLNAVPAEKVCAQPAAVVLPKEKNAVPYYTARFADAGQIPAGHPFRRVFLPLHCRPEVFAETGAGVEIPRGIFGLEDKIRKKLSILKKTGVRYALCGSLSACALAEEAGLEVFGDFGLNVFNSNTAALVDHPIVSFELRLEAVNRIHAPDTGCLVYGRLPLMLTRNCPIQAHIGCAACKKQGVLTDRKGYAFPVSCSPYSCTELLNSVPLYMGDRMQAVKTDFAHFYFSVEPADEVRHILTLFEHGEKPDFPYTRGLYERGTL